MKDPVPLLKLTRTRGEDAVDLAAGVQPSAFIVNHSDVQLRADVLRPNCPPLPIEQSKGPVIVSAWSAITRSGKYPPSLAVGVGQQEDPPAHMACARFSRREHACLWCVAHAAKLCGDVGKSQADMSLDIFAEHPFWLHLVDDAGDFGPQVPGIFFPSPCAGEAEGLAWIAGRDDMNAAAPWSAVEGFKIVPNRRWCQGRVFHPRHESGRRMSFPLDESHSAISGLCDMQAEIEACISCAERDAAKVVRFGT